MKFKFVSNVPPHLWYILRSDLLYYKKKDFLVVVDYFYKILVVRQLPNSTSGTVIKDLFIIFPEYGKPYLFRSDNGPCYASKELKFSM